MEKFDINAYLESLARSESINDCPKVYPPEINAEQNYIFISYAHEDYKEVYKTLAYMRECGVHFWYDALLPAGKDWDKEASARIRHPNCSGAIFFLSKNLFLSNSVINVELPCILGVDSNGNALDGVEPLNYFSVNLTNNKPSGIIREAMLESELDTEWLGLLASAFSNKSTYISITEYDYEKKLADQIRTNFNVIDKCVCAEENFADYDGETMGGRPHGLGKMYFLKTDMRDYYEGEFANGAILGKGVLVFKNGERYEGDFVNGAMHGKGKFSYANGVRTEPITQSPDYPHILQRINRIYEGDWKHDVRDGEGTLTSTMTGNVIYDGQWRNDLPNGYGRAKFTDHTSYEGEWKDGKPHGKGNYRDDFMTFLYVGDWIEGRQEGYGTLYWDYPNGGNYTGEFKNDKQDGYGVMTHPDGRVEKGIWKNGNLIEPQE